jgi:hypothetical protein
MIMSPAGLRHKNNRTGEDEQNFTRPDDLENRGEHALASTGTTGSIVISLKAYTCLL